jgi:hypothetical protein
MDKENTVYIYIYIYIYIVEYNSTVKKKKEEILSFVTTWTDLEGIMLSEISHAQKNKYCLISFIYGILKKKEFIEVVSKMVDGEMLVSGLLNYS